MTDLRSDWQKRQAALCSCKGSDDYCPCQNVDFAAPEPTRPSAPPSTVGEDATAGEFVMVPREPTEAMVLAGHRASEQGRRGIWNAMIAAAPKPTQPSIGMDEREAEVVAAVKVSYPDRVLHLNPIQDTEREYWRPIINAILALSATSVDVGEVLEVLGDLIAGQLDPAGDGSTYITSPPTAATMRRARALHDRLTGKDQ